MSIKFVFIKLPRFDLHRLDLLEVFLVVEAVSKNVAECA